jgi:hypothetical protein
MDARRFPVSVPAFDGKEEKETAKNAQTAGVHFTKTLQFLQKAFWIPNWPTDWTKMDRMMSYYDKFKIGISLK